MTVGGVSSQGNPRSGSCRWCGRNRTVHPNALRSWVWVCVPCDMAWLFPIVAGEAE